MTFNLFFLYVTTIHKLSRATLLFMILWFVFGHRVLQFFLDLVHLSFNFCYLIYCSMHGVMVLLLLMCIIYLLSSDAVSFVTVQHKKETYLLSLLFRSRMLYRSFYSLGLFHVFNLPLFPSRRGTIYMLSQNGEQNTKTKQIHSI